ncbi:MAG: hypothetical protein AAGC68_12405, partial [Verrucomicrobiota bacterium]
GVQSVDIETSTLMILHGAGEVLAWHERKGFVEAPEREEPFVQVATGGNHCFALDDAGEIHVWAHSYLAGHERGVALVEGIPSDGPFLRIKATDFQAIAQRPDGTWAAWGDDQGRGQIEKINNLGPALDIELFNVNDETGSKFLWIEPITETEGENNASADASLRPEEKLKILLPELGRPASAKFESQRRSGGILREWSEKGEVLSTEPAAGIRDLVAVDEMLGSGGTRWIAYQANSKTVSSDVHMNGRTDLRFVRSAYTIEWPDRIGSIGASIPVDDSITNAISLDSNGQTTLFLTPSGRVRTAATESSRSRFQNLLSEIESYEGVTQVFAGGRSFGLFIPGRGPIYYNNGNPLPTPGNPEDLVQVDYSGTQAIGLKKDGSVIKWSTEGFHDYPHAEEILRVPDDLKPAIRVRAFQTINAVQFEDGTWHAWGYDRESGMIDRINSLGVALDLEVFSQNEGAGERMLWIEPSVEETESDSEAEPGALSPAQKRELLLPKLGRSSTDEFKKQREAGGLLRSWSEKGGVLSTKAAADFKDLIAIDEMPRSNSTNWIGYRSDGEVVSSVPYYNGRYDLRLLRSGYSIEWPDQLAMKDSLIPIDDSITNVVSLDSNTQIALFLTPDGRVKTAATESSRSIYREILSKLETYEGVSQVFSNGRALGLFIPDRGPVFYFNGSPLPIPPGPDDLVQVDFSGTHAIGLREDGSVVKWTAQAFHGHPHSEEILRVPDNLKPAIRVLTAGTINAVQFEDGTWRAWGHDRDTGLIDRINTIGVALDLEVFSFHGITGERILWIEPSAE